MNYSDTRKTAIVTGSTKGIGRGIAEELITQGYNVVITGRKLEDAQAVATEISTSVGTAVGVAFNIEDRQTFMPLIEATLRHFGRIDLLVNNALSQSCVPPIEALSDDQIEFALTSSITNVFLLSQKVLPELIKTEGNIINISSAVTNRHIYGMSLYTISKGAMNQMTKVLAAEWAKHKVRVNAISPGFVHTSALSYFGLPEEVITQHYEHVKQYHPLERIGEPKDIGGLAAFIASDDASFMTGSVVDCDAGCSVQGIRMLS